MNKIKVVLQALTGYAGSSESPEKFSMRFTGIIIGVVSQFAPLIAVFVSHYGIANVNIDALTAVVGSLTLSVGCIVWVVGAIKACWKAAKDSPQIGGIFRR